MPMEPCCLHLLHVDMREERECDVVMMTEIQLAHVTVYGSFLVECHIASSGFLHAVVKRLAGYVSALRRPKLEHVKSLI